MQHAGWDRLSQAPRGKSNPPTIKNQGEQKQATKGKAGGTDGRGREEKEIDLFWAKSILNHA